MNEPIMGYWRKAKGRCQQCGRPVEHMYEIRDGEVKGWFCGRYCYERAKEAKEHGQD